MRGAVVLGDRDVDLREWPDPSPGPGEALVRMKASGLCGSELNGLYRPARERRRQQPTWGYIGGHEPAGVIESLGRDVHGLHVGDRVMVYHIQGCGYCKYCASGWMLHCLHAKRSYGWDLHGGHADLILVDARNCVIIPNELSFVDGACCACGVGTAFQSLTRVGLSGRDIAVIVGLGPVGLGAVLLAKGMGATVIGVDLVPERVALARRLGADTVIDASHSDPVPVIKDLTDGEGAHVAMDYSGSAIGRNYALDAVRIWGRVAFVGEGNTTTIEPSPQILHKQLTVVGSWVFGLWQMHQLAAFLATKHIAIEQMVTHRFSLEKISEAMRLFDGGHTGKVVIVWP